MCKIALPKPEEKYQTSQKHIRAGGVFQNLIFYNSISCLFALMDDLTKPSSCLSFLATHFMNRRERFKIVFSPIFFMLYREQGNLKAFSMSCLYNNVSLLTFVEKCPVKTMRFEKSKFSNRSHALTDATKCKRCRHQLCLIR